MNPFAKYGIAIAIVFGALFGAYTFGHSVAEDEFQVKLSRINEDLANQSTAHALERAGFEAKQRADEAAKADQMANIDAQHQKELTDAKIISDRTIAGFRSGAISLRDKFTSCQRRASGAAGALSIATGSSDAAASIELRNADAEFLVRLGTEADQVADQLRACQVIVRNDRQADGKGPSKP